MDMEKNFVLNTNLTTTEHVIDCGLSGVRNFEPSVRISNNEDSQNLGRKVSISFDSKQWLLFIEILKLNEANDIRFIEDISIVTTTVNGFKILHVSRNDNNLYFISQDVSNIVELHDQFIKSRLEMLLNLNFQAYYKKFLNAIVTMKKHSVQSIEELITIFCNLNSSIENLILCECMIFIKDKILNEIEYVN